MDQILIAWIGDAYIDASLKQQHGPISATLHSGGCSNAYLLYSYPLDQTAHHKALPKLQYPGDIYQITDQQFQVVIKQHKKTKLHLQITPATPAMRAYYFRNIYCYPCNHLLQETL